MYLANNPGFDCKSEVWTSQILMGIMLYLIIFMSIKTTVKRSLTLFFLHPIFIFNFTFIYFQIIHKKWTSACTPEEQILIYSNPCQKAGPCLFVFSHWTCLVCASKTSAALKEFRFLDILLKISPPKECTSVFTVFSWRLSFKQTFTGNYVRCLLKKR